MPHLPNTLQSPTQSEKRQRNLIGKVSSIILPIQNKYFPNGLILKEFLNRVAPVLTLLLPPTQTRQMVSCVRPCFYFLKQSYRLMDSGRLNCRLVSGA